MMLGTAGDVSMPNAAPAVTRLHTTCASGDLVLMWSRFAGRGIGAGG